MHNYRQRLNRRGMVTSKVVLKILICTFLLGIRGVAWSAQPLPLGTVTPGTQKTTCPPGYTCRNYKVTCPGVPDDSVWVATKPSSVAPKGMIVYFPGGGGDSWF